MHGGIIMIIIIFFIPFLCVATDIITPTKPLAMNQTLISSSEVFELGFVDLGNNNLYLGIWYYQIQPRTIVWLANRDTPVNSSFAKLTIREDGNINLVDQAETVIWSSNQYVPVINTVAQLLDSGNFVLRRENDDNPENYLWQSFDYPTDTLLSGMKLGWSRKNGINRFLRSWKSDNDPGSGDYLWKMNTDGFPEILISKKEKVMVWRSGPWNGERFSGVPEMKGVSIIRFEFQETHDEIYYSYEMLNTSVRSRLIVSSSGKLQRFIWSASANTWNIFWFHPRDICDDYGQCGPFGVCDANVFPFCKCLRGFRPRDKRAWFDLQDASGGCVRKSEIDCRSDGFLPLKNMKLPEGSKAFVDQTTNLSECGEMCKRNCSCTGYANMDISRAGSGCVFWVGNLMDMRQYAESEGGGQDLYVRVALSDLGQSVSIGNSQKGSADNNHVVKIVAITIGICAGLVTLLIILYRKRKNTQRLKKAITLGRGSLERIDYESKMDELDLPLFDFTTLVLATNNFSEENKLGQGGFGCVYKGTLPEGEVVAVKRLSRVSDQGIEELINEVRLIAKLQHRNLVRLLGCCIEVEEKLLIYEFMENKSLDIFLFEKEKRMELSWHMRLHIICGIARGLLYLHQDSRFKIIHRDLKASNILLDKNMNPKISDFGMARIFGCDQIEAQTKKVVGTYGYMSPEYAMDGHFSTKSDIFSFGVLVLEIVSGQKNRGSSYTSTKLNLLGHTWTLWKEDRGLELVDESVQANFLEDDALRCIQIGLLCVQENAEDRPSISKVLLMLNSSTIELPQPKYPGFFIRKKDVETECSSKQDDSSTVNKVTITMLDGR
ncbi:hypothetical protein OSB04_002230 [Centaurea solstitialis]|uniref:Receptor-like serine/threonine-protein kinase n=1 Tax=Centaurea solstitialis TaxID=347529 RepID=A0AA38TSY2_9ASTR|nr:hypothetical protein OSB04_002230 [Centaurea solstitialis]